MPNLLVKVRKKMSITANRKVHNALEGEYASVFKGRSMDFEDLREYVPNDDIKDVDWKATARSGQTLIKRYVAIRKYRILLVVDTGKAMAATTQAGEMKRDVTVMTAGIIASVAQRHADLVGLVAGNSKHLTYLPPKDSRQQVERILQHIYNDTSLESPKSNLTNLLEYVKRNIKQRMMLIIISDNIEFGNTEEKLLRRLDAQHEILFIAIDDVDPSDKMWNQKFLYDVEKPSASLPKFIRSQKLVEEAFKNYVATQWKQSSQLLKRLGISTVRIEKEDDALSKIIRLLEQQKHARKK